MLYLPELMRAFLIIVVCFMIPFGAGQMFVDAIAMSKVDKLSLQVPCLIASVTIIIATSAFRLIAVPGNPDSLFEGVQRCIQVLSLFAIGAAIRAALNLRKEWKGEGQAESETLADTKPARSP
jgi:hypothetical protein